MVSNNVQLITIFWWNFIDSSLRWYIAVAGKSIHVAEFKNEVIKRFKFNDLEKLNYILGIKIEYGNDEIMFNKSKTLYK